MGNTHVKPHPTPRTNKKQVHWKAADRPSPPGKPSLVTNNGTNTDLIKICWRKPSSDGGSPITGYLVEHRRTGSTQWTNSTPLMVPFLELTVSGLEAGWRYQFRVRAQNAVGLSDPSELSEPFTVTLQKSSITAPRFLKELHDTVALEDEKAEFSVEFLGQPQPIVKWFKDNFEIFSTRRIRILTEVDKSTLTIHQSALSDEGEIKCTATNRAGHASTKAKLTLEATPSIRLARQFENGLVFEVNEPIRIKVAIAGRPPPLVFWSHNGESIQNSERYIIEHGDRFSILQINNAQRHDTGEYQIKAVNKLGEDTASFPITVTDVPSPPGRARVVMTLGRSVTLAWSSPKDDGGAKVGNYIVEYCRIGWNVWLKAAKSRNLTTILGDLVEGSEYKFRIKAESPYGISDPSDESDVIFIPDPKRGILEPGTIRSRSLPRDEESLPSRAILRKQRMMRSRSSSRTSLVPILDEEEEEEEAPPVRPQRKQKSPSKSPTPSPRLKRKSLLAKLTTGENQVNPLNLDRNSMARELAYGIPERFNQQNFGERNGAQVDNPETRVRNFAGDSKVVGSFGVVGSLENNSQGLGNVSQSIGDVSQDFGNVSQSFGNVSQDFGNVSQGFGNGSQGFGNVSQGFGNVSQGFGNVSQGFGNASAATNSFGTTSQTSTTFEDTHQDVGNVSKAANDFGNVSQGFGNVSEGFGNVSEGFGNVSQGFGKVFQGFGNVSHGFGNASAATNSFGTTSQTSTTFEDTHQAVGNVSKAANDFGNASQDDSGFVNASQGAKGFGNVSHIASSFGNASQTANCGSVSQAANFGNASQTENFGNASQAANFGNASQAANFGNASQAAANFGNASQAANFENASQAASFGNVSAFGNVSGFGNVVSGSGNVVSSSRNVVGGFGNNCQPVKSFGNDSHHVGGTHDESQVVKNFGNASQAANFGNASQAAYFGNASQAAHFGNASQTANFGNASQAANFGNASQAASFGNVGGFGNVSGFGNVVGGSRNVVGGFGNNCQPVKGFGNDSHHVGGIHESQVVKNFGNGSQTVSRVRNDSHGSGNFDNDSRGVGNTFYRFGNDWQGGSGKMGTRMLPNDKQRSLSPLAFKGNQQSGSSELMLVLYPEEKQTGSTSFRNMGYSFEENAVAPPTSLSAPELGMEMPTFDNLRPFASSTELMHFHQLEKINQEALAEEIKRQLQKNAQLGRRLSLDIPTIQINSQINQDIVGLENQQRRLSAGVVPTPQTLWAQRRLSLKTSNEMGNLLPNKLRKFPDSPESRQELDKLLKRSASEELERRELEAFKERVSLSAQSSFERRSIEVVEEEGEYTVSETDTDSSEDDRLLDIEPPLIRSPDEELQTYRPGGMAMVAQSPPRQLINTPPARKITDEPFEILRVKKQPPDPSLIPKPILKKKPNDGFTGNGEVPNHGRSLGKFNSTFQRPRSQSLTPSPFRTFIPEPKPLELPISKRSQSVTRDGESEGRRGSISTLAKLSTVAGASVVIPGKLMDRRKDEEEAKVVADHYADIVKNYGQRNKSQIPLYMDKERLKQMEEKDKQKREEYSPSHPNSTKATSTESEYSQSESVVSDNSTKDHRENVTKRFIRKRGDRTSPVLRKRDYREQGYNRTPSASPSRLKDNTSTPQMSRRYSSGPRENSKTPPRQPEDSLPYGSRPKISKASLVLGGRPPDSKTTPSRLQDSGLDGGRPRGDTKTQRGRRGSSDSSRASPGRNYSRLPSKSPLRASPVRRRDARTSVSPGRTRDRSSVRYENWRQSFSKSPSPMRSHDGRIRSSSGVRRTPESFRKSVSPGRRLTRESTTQTSFRLLGLEVDDFSRTSSPIDALRQEQLLAEATEHVRGTVDYATDFAMFIVACWLYMFKNELYAVPVLLIMVYRQLGQEIRRRLPAWVLKRIDGRRKRK